MRSRFGAQLHRMAAVSVFTVLGILTSMFPAAAQAQGAGEVAPHVSTGVLKNVGQTSPKPVAALGSALSRPALHVMPLRRPPTVAQATASNAPTSVRTAASAAVAGAASPRLLRSFDGVNSTDNLNASGTGLEPPDEGVGVGDGYVVNNVNLAFTIYSTNGVVVSGPISDTAFFDEPAAFTQGTITSDPRAYFDAATHHWFMTIWEDDNGSVSGQASSHVDIAVSSSNNPTGAWFLYRLDTTDAIDAGCPCFPDFPSLGIDRDNLYVSTNEFSIAGPEFNGAQVYAIPKAQLESGATAQFVHYGNLSVGGVLAYHLQPAITNGSAPAEYFMASLDPNNTFDNRLAVWALTDPSAVAEGGRPTLSATVIGSEAYGFPVNAQTPPGFNTLIGEPTSGQVTADFDAMQEVEYIDGHLLGALNTSITIPGDPSSRDGVAWFDVRPRVQQGVISPSTSVKAQGYIAAHGLFLLYPHIERNPQGLTAIAFSFGGLGTDLSAGYVTMPAGGSGFGAINTAGAGAASDNGFTGTPLYGSVGRWGDYSAGQLDGAGNLWLATQYIPGQGDLVANWGDRIFELQK